MAEEKKETKDRQPALCPSQPVFLHQFAFEDRGVFVCGENGQPLSLAASGVQNGLHWAVFQVQTDQPWVELRINKFSAELVRVETQGRQVLWRGTIYKDNQNPPRQFFPCFRASITTLICSKRQCSGFHPFEGNQMKTQPQPQSRQDLRKKKEVKKVIRLEVVQKVPLIPQKVVKKRTKKEVARKEEEIFRASTKNGNN